jgi:hypothetical protein
MGPVAVCSRVSLTPSIQETRVVEPQQKPPRMCNAGLATGTADVRASGPRLAPPPSCAARSDIILDVGLCRYLPALKTCHLVHRYTRSSHAGPATPRESGKYALPPPPRSASPAADCETRPRPASALSRASASSVWPNQFAPKTKTREKTHFYKASKSPDEGRYR